MAQANPGEKEESPGTNTQFQENRETTGSTKSTTAREWTLRWGQNDKKTKKHGKEQECEPISETKPERLTKKKVGKKAGQFKRE